MRTIPLVACALVAVGCHPDCYTDTDPSLPTALRTSDGATLTVRPAPGIGALFTVARNCPDNTVSVKSEADVCAPAATDDACVQCLKGACCQESLDWYNGSNGASVVTCINAACPGACPRSK
jgi:hypothetical protein